jgi:hypothetical protein
MEIISMDRFIKKYGQLTFGSIFIFYYLYTLFNSFISEEVTIATILTLVIYFQCVGEFLYFHKKTGKPRLQDWMRLSLFIMLILDFMAIVNNANGSAIVKFSVQSISLNDSIFTMILIVFVLLSLDIAYVISNSIEKKQTEHSDYSIKRTQWVFGILIVSTVIQSYFLFSGLSGYGSDLKYTTGIASLLKTIAGVLNPFALIVSAYIIFIENKHHPSYQLIFYSMLFIQILIGLLSGMKEIALIPILYVGIVFLISGRRIPQKIIYIGVFILALLYPLNNAYRNVINTPSLNTGSSTLNLVIAFKNVQETPLLETLSSGIESYGGRGSMFPYLQYSISIEPDWSYYKNMTRYAFLPVVWLIPRAIWSGKPRSDIGGVLNEHIIGYRGQSAVTPTSIGWAYLEGGIFFVIPIFILIGLLFETVDKRNYQKPLIIIFYIILLHTALKPEGDPYFYFATMVQNYIMYWVLFKFIGVNRLEKER